MLTPLPLHTAQGLDGDQVTRATFPLPTLGPRLAALARGLHDDAPMNRDAGTGEDADKGGDAGGDAGAGEPAGFFILRGLRPGDYSVEDGMVVFLGVQAYIAEGRGRQDGGGNMVVHIISDDSVGSGEEEKLRRCHVRHSKKSIAFHTDSNADILAFQTRGAAVRGGQCVLASVHTIYNELAAMRPDVVRTLARGDWPFALPYFHYRPILFYHDTHLIVNLSPPALLGSTSHPRPSSIPSITPRQREALDVFNRVAEKHRFEFGTQPGDLHFVNNLAVLHRRCGFANAGDIRAEEVKTSSAENKRHLVRMHIRSAELGWSIPPVLRPDWEQAFEDEETGEEQQWHIVPMPPGFFPLRVDCH